MNFLAHALLAGGDAELEVGGVLGDFVRGRPDPALPAGVRRGITLHRAIDTHTDRHPRVAAVRRLFAPPWRRYAGIMLDVWFDHCLARDFARWSDVPLADFSRRLRQRLDTHEHCLPPRLRRFVTFMHARNLPAAYADSPVIAEVLAGLGRRLTRPNPLDQALPVLQTHEAALQDAFDAFFPDLVAFAQTWRQQHPA